jgi:hypothetical protein
LFSQETLTKTLLLWKQHSIKQGLPVKKKALLTITFISVLLSSAIAGIQLVNLGKANPFMPSGSWSDEPVPPSINVESPSETLNISYGSDVWLNFTVTVPWTDWYNTQSGDLYPEYLYPESYATTLGTLTDVTFSLDGNAENNVSKISESPIEVSKVYHPYGGVLRFTVNLGCLSVGRHTIVINAEGSAYYGNLTHGAFSDNFAYDFQEGDETKFVQSSADISFIVSSELIQEPSPATGQESAQEPFPTVPVVVATIASVAVVGVGLLVYFKKRKH